MTEPRPRLAQFWLRPLRLDDIPTVAAWYESVDDLAMFHRRMSVPLSPEALAAQWRESLLETEPRESYWFAIDDDEEERRLVAFTGIEDISYAHGDALMPIFVSAPVRRRGIAVRARALLLDIAFDQLRLARITSIHRADNTGSAKMNKACGFREEGRMRSAWFGGGVRVDLMVFGILADEWREHRGVLRETLGTKTVVTLGDDRSSQWCWPRTGDGEDAE
jgi:RimJ/RimL family protein N-acetyltransferase